MEQKEKQTRRCVIVGGAEIHEYARIKSVLKEDDFFIFCDGGLNHIDGLSVIPDLIVGDFDSHVRPENDVINGRCIETIQLPKEKDWTDTYFAAMEAVKRNFSEFLLIGVIGQRFDHSLVNISTLLYLKNQNKKATLLDDYSEMEIVGNEEIYIPDTFSYFSLLCIDGNVSGVTIKNAKYSVSDVEIKTDFQYASSNEVVKGKKASVIVKEGCLLLIKIY